MFVYKVLAEIACDEGGDASSASAAVLVSDPAQEPFSPLAPQSSVLHCGSQCDLRPSHRSSGGLTLLISRINCTWQHLFT